MLAVVHLDILGAVDNHLLSGHYLNLVFLLLLAIRSGAKLGEPLLAFILGAGPCPHNNSKPHLTSLVYFLIEAHTIELQ